MENQDWEWELPSSECSMPEEPPLLLENEWFYKQWEDYRPPINYYIPIAKKEDKPSAPTPIVITLDDSSSSSEGPASPSKSEKEVVSSPKLRSSMKASKKKDKGRQSASTVTRHQEKKKHMQYVEACEILNPVGVNCGSLDVPLSTIGAGRPGLRKKSKNQLQDSQLKGSGTSGNQGESTSSTVANASSSGRMTTRSRKPTSTLVYEQPSIPELPSGEKQEENKKGIRDKAGAIMRWMKGEASSDENIADQSGRKQNAINKNGLVSPQLTEEMVAIIEEVKTKGPIKDVLAQVSLLDGYNIRLTGEDFETLCPRRKLNDNIINSYLGLIAMRSREYNSKFPTVFAFHTFFYPKLLRDGYNKSLKRWTQKDDIFGYDLLLVPIHAGGSHWTLVCIDFRKKFVLHFDSAGKQNKECLKALFDFISKEFQERKKLKLKKSEWLLQHVDNAPQQDNEWDCGVFVCKYANFLSRDEEFTFSQEAIPYYRNRMVYELYAQDLMYP